jgi:hypothetical protein
LKEGNLTRVVALTKPDTSIFTTEELKAVDYWIEHIDKDHTAASISKESHDYAWEVAKMGEELPPYAIFANRIREPDDEELGQLQERAKAMGLI